MPERIRKLARRQPVAKTCLQSDQIHALSVNILKGMLTAERKVRPHPLPSSTLQAHPPLLSADRGTCGVTCALRVLHLEFIPHAFRSTGLIFICSIAALCAAVFLFGVPRFCPIPATCGPGAAWGRTAGQHMYAHHANAGRPSMVE